MENVKFTVPYHELWGVSLAKAKDSSRYAIAGVLFEPVGHLVATDGHRLHIAVVDKLEGLAKPVLVNLDKLPKPNRNQVGAVIEIDGDRVLCTLSPGGKVIVGEIAEGSFPPYKDVIPVLNEETLQVANVDADYLKDARALVTEEGHGIPLQDRAMGPSVLTGENTLAVVMPIGCDDHHVAARDAVNKLAGEIRAAR